MNLPGTVFITGVVGVLAYAFTSASPGAFVVDKHIDIAYRELAGMSARPPYYSEMSDMAPGNLRVTMEREGGESVTWNYTINGEPFGATTAVITPDGDSTLVHFEHSAHNPQFPEGNRANDTDWGSMRSISRAAYIEHVTAELQDRRFDRGPMMQAKREAVVANPGGFARSTMSSVHEEINAQSSPMNQQDMREREREIRRRREAWRGY